MVKLPDENFHGQCSDGFVILLNARQAAIGPFEMNIHEGKVARYS